jgi:dTDP-4-amino-4,6-dideoxygalactose transaminase
VFVDIDEESYTLDPAKLEAAITGRTKAIMPVHLYGQPADMTPILRIAERRGIAVIEDAAQAHGAEYRGKRCGAMGRVAGFSFYPGKNLGAYGEGGAVVTSDASLNAKVRMLRDWGQARKYEHVMKGYNMRLEGLQGAVLRVKLRHLETWTEQRRRAAALYQELLGAAEHLRPPRVYPDRRHVFHLYVVRVSDRDGFMAHMRGRRVQTSIHYPQPVHLLPAYADLGYRAGQFEVSERVATEVVSLPLFPEITDAQVHHAAEAALAWSPKR